MRPTSPDRDEKKEKDDDVAAVAAFQRAADGFRRSPVSVGGVAEECVAAGLEGLQSAHDLCKGGLVASERPTLFYPLPSSVRTSDVRPEHLFFVPYGWDTRFGGSMTISLGMRGYDRTWAGRVYMTGTDQRLAAIEAGRFTCVLVKNRVPALAFDLDMTATDEARAFYLEQRTRAMNHRGERSDDGARFWDTIRHLYNDTKALHPRHRLALGWVRRYADAVGELRWELDAFRQQFQWPPDACLPEPWSSWAALFRDPSLSVDTLVEHVAAERTRRPDWLTALLAPPYHDAIHAVMGDHSPLCNAPSHAVRAFLLSSEMTECGARVPVLRDGTVGFHGVAPEKFEGIDPGDYWPRILHLPAEWNRLVEPGDVPANLTKDSSLLASMPKADNRDANGDAADALLEEALAERRWTIPPDAVLELPIGPFSHLQLRERDHDVNFLLRTESGEFSAGGIILAKEERRLWWEAMAVDGSDDTRTAAASGLYLLFAAIIRDFVVVEERERVFGARASHERRRAGVAATEGPRVVYLPRVRYVGDPDIDRCRADLGQAESSKRPHAVRPHLRRCDAPSTSQLFLARRYGIDVPQGFTFVRAHERGKHVRDVIYRSRSALQCLYRTAPKGAESRVAWFDFERDVHALMGALGFSVQHVGASRRGDHGVDVYATKGGDLDEVCWVIQCKAYAATKKVGPHVVRELIGALADYSSGTRGMVVTTSSFSADAEELARRHNVRLMGGDEFARLVTATTT